MKTAMDSLRKYILKTEIEPLLKNLSEELANSILNSMFKNPYTTGPHFSLKENIKNLEDIGKALDSSGANADLSANVKSLFWITQDLQLPSELKSLFNKREKVAILIGAGVSRLLGMPGWNQLAEKAIDYLYERGKINYFEKERIVHETLDAKQKLTIFHDFIDKSQEDAKDFFTKQLQEKTVENNPYKILANFPCAKLTTNIDDEFYNALNKKLSSQSNGQPSNQPAVPPTGSQAKQEYNNFSEDLFPLNSNTIYQIHGSLKEDFPNTILTMRDYIKSYFEESGLRRFLTRLFHEYTVIFIGYGLEEFQILEHIISKERRHYAVIGNYFTDVNLFEVRRKYYSNLNIDIFAYYLDFSGHQRLVEVLKSWLAEINMEVNKISYDLQREIEEADAG